jgi:NitT/TauT family transport system substrate-binding protein
MNRIACVAVSLLLVALATGCARRDAPTTALSSPATEGRKKVVLQSDWFPQAEHGGYYQALARGFYAEAGLDVTIWPGGPGAGIKLKVARGDADFGMLRSDDVILAVSRDMPLVMVAATMQHDPQALMVHADSPVRTFQDLDGRAVIGNVGMAWFPYLENKYGIRIERRQNTYGLGEFLANPATIQQCMVTNEPFFAAKQGRKVRTLPLSDSGYDCYQVLFTRRDVVRQSPEKIRAFVGASIRGWRDYLEEDPSPAHDLILQRNPDMTRELLEFSRGELKRRSYVHGDAARGEDIGQLSVARLTEQVETLLQLKILERPVAVADAASTAFLPAPVRAASVK